jgi:hypothetical protein
MAGGATKEESEHFVPLRWPLSDGRDDVYLFRTFEPIPDDYVLLPERSEAELTHYLRRLAEDPFGLQALREIVLEEEGAWAGQAHTKDELPALVSHWIATRRLRLAKAPVWPWPKLEPFAPELFVRASAPVAETGVFSVLVVDDLSDDPMPNVKLRVKLPPSGAEQDVVTDSSGRVDISKVPLGRATLTSVTSAAKLAEAVTLVKLGATSSQARPGQTTGGGQAASGGSQGGGQAGGQSGGQQKPLTLLRILEIKVTKKGTLASIAESHGMAWQDLAQFNWGTSKTEEVNKRLYNDVGCRKRSVDGKNYVFDDTDRPGIIYVPQPIHVTGMTIGELHMLRAKRAGPIGFCFSV